MKKEKVVEAVYCDNCGEQINDYTMFSIVCYSPTTYSKDTGVVTFENKLAGDYCPKCKYIMSLVFYDLVKDVFVERYGDASLETDKRIFDYAKEHGIGCIDWDE